MIDISQITAFENFNFLKTQNWNLPKIFIFCFFLHKVCEFVDINIDVTIGVFYYAPFFLERCIICNLNVFIKISQ